MGCPPQVQNQILLTSNLTPTPPLCQTVNKVNCIWKRFFRSQIMDIVYLNGEE